MKPELTTEIVKLVIFGSETLGKLGFSGPKNDSEPDPTRAFGQLSGFRASSGRVGFRSGNQKIFGLGSGDGRKIRQFLPECAALSIYSSNSDVRCAKDSSRL